MSDTYLTVPAVAAQLSVNVQTIRRYIADGKLAAYRFGRDYRIAPADLTAFLASTRVTS